MSYRVIVNYSFFRDIAIKRCLIHAAIFRKNNCLVLSFFFFCFSRTLLHIHLLRLYRRISQRKNYPSMLMLSFTVLSIHLHGVVHIQGQETIVWFFLFFAIIYLSAIFSGITDIGGYWYYLLPRPNERVTNKKKKRRRCRPQSVCRKKIQVYQSTSDLNYRKIQ